MRGATLSALSCIHLALISIHAPTRGATTLTVTVAMLSLNFNPRSHEGSDLCWFLSCPFTHIFQSTLPRGERRQDAGRCSAVHWISIHAPTRGATHLLPQREISSVFQSTLPRGERPASANPAFASFVISIHAPTRGATAVSGDSIVFSWISIHAPTRGATMEYLLINSIKIISIHAPTRGATGTMVGEAIAEKFQSTLPRGERQLICLSVAGSGDFNPRSHEGSDFIGSSTLSKYVYFNPRSHEGSDRVG